MISLKRYNKQNHKYIYNIQWDSGINCGYTIYGKIGRIHYMMYTLKECIKLYNQEAREKM